MDDGVCARHVVAGAVRGASAAEHRQGAGASPAESSSQLVPSLHVRACDCEGSGEASKSRKASVSHGQHFMCSSPCAHVESIVFASVYGTYERKLAIVAQWNL